MASLRYLSILNWHLNLNNFQIVPKGVLKKLLAEIRNCRVCETNLPFGANPIIQASNSSKITIVGQAPGKIVHESSVPWTDKSGENLRKWLGIEKGTFYNKNEIALMPMGFSFPGTGKSGDLAPRPECAPLWHGQLLKSMKQVKLTILIGQYAQAHYVGKKAKQSLTETVANYKDYLPAYFVLPHPSPRNNIWQTKNEWFATSVLPELKRIVGELLA